MKARSRLKTADSSPVAIKKPSHSFPTSTPPSIRTISQPKTTPIKPQVVFGSSSPLSAHIAHLPTLIISLIFYTLTVWILHTIQPASISNLLLPRLYFPFQISIFLANWFLASFIWLKTRRGYLTAILIQIFIFLKLQKIDFSWQVGLGLLGLFVIIELLLTYLETRSHRHANFHQILVSHRRRART